MRRLSSCVLLLAGVVTAQEAADVASVQGTVTHSITGGAIARAHVTLRGSGADAKYYGALTTAEGKFSIIGIAPGTYFASVERVGFFMPGELRRAADVFVLRAGDKKEDLRLKLAPLGSVSGRVLDAEGEPVEGAEVSLETSPLGYSARVEGETDGKGRFNLPGVLPGRYRVLAAKSRWIQRTPERSGPPEIRTDGTAEPRYLPTFFPGAIDYESAARVEVGTGAEISSIEIRLVRSRHVRVSGRVMGIPPDAQYPGMGFAQARAMSTRRLKRDGTFEFWDPDPGKYFISATWTSGGQSVCTAPVDIEVGESDIEKIELRAVPPPYDFSGQVVFDDEQARPRQEAAAEQGRQQQPRSRLGPAGPSIELRRVDRGFHGERTFSAVAGDGTFRFAGITPGRYRAALSWPGAFVKGMTLGQSQIEGNLLDLRAGAGGGPLSVVASSAAGSVTGTVYEGSDPAPNALIALVPDDFVSEGDATTTSSDANGTYTFSNVKPGRYRIAAVDEGDGGPQAGYLGDYEEIVAHIDVQPGGKVSKDLRRHAPVR